METHKPEGMTRRNVRNVCETRTSDFRFEGWWSFR